MPIEDARNMAAEARTACDYQTSKRLFAVIREQRVRDEHVITFDAESEDFKRAFAAYKKRLEEKRKEQYENDLWAAASPYVSKGMECEKAKNIDGAIAAYEQAAAVGAPAPYCYERLRILYKKRKDFDNMQRAIAMKEAAQDAYEKRTGRIYY